ncbi:hypothetical protein [Sorangium sp. So ce693]|uniref:hypothetical protein n=1 Tax=Sorangium sp. So ce693 TaxID=3133318 RepID=UPI003F6163F2
MNRSSIALLVAVGIGCSSPSSTSPARVSAAPAGTGRAPAPSATTPPAGTSAVESQTTAAAPQAAADSAEGPEVSLDDPRIQKIRALYQDIQARNDLKRSELRFECAGGEGRGELRLYQADGAVQKAEIAAADAGHGESTYQFYYDQGQLVFALHDDGSWAFDGTRGTPDKPATTSSVTQRRYYLQEGEPVLCIKKQAKGPTEELGPLLEQAPNRPDDCSRAKKIRELAITALAGAKTKTKDELKKLLCT